jgi:putative hydrolase of the HAD superfamily
VDCIKPDQRLFDIALPKAAVSAGDCIYIGDNYYDDAIGSRQVGMPAMIINRFGKLGVEEIRDCPVIGHLSDLFEIIEFKEQK